MRRRSGPQQLSATGKGIWCNSSHDGQRATAERQHAHHHGTYLGSILGQVSRWRLACGSMSKSGLGPGLACLPTWGKGRPRAGDARCGRVLVADETRGASVAHA